MGQEDNKTIKTINSQLSSDVFFDFISDKILFHFVIKNSFMQILQILNYFLMQIF